MLPFPTFGNPAPRFTSNRSDRKDLLKFTALLKKEKKQSPRSVHNKFACLQTFLAANGLPKLIAKSDRPKFVKQEVEIYEHGELEIRHEDFCGGDNATAASPVRTRKTNVSWRYSRTRASVWLT
jgi:hypothetical protein